MKFTFALFVLSALSLNAKACPDLQGTYQCASNFYDRPFIIKMDQSENDGITRYTQTMLGSNSVQSIIADNILYVSPKDGDIVKIRVSCSDKKLTIDDTHIYNSTGTPDTARTIKDLYLDKDDNLDTQTKFISENPTYSGTINELCVRMN
jgi:hypothetical protein